MKIKSDKSLTKKIINVKSPRIAIVVSKFNETVTSNLLEGAMMSLKSQKVTEKNIKVYYVPGAFEIPIVLKKICELKSKKKFDGVITLGCVIKGETAHFEYISNAVSNNISALSVKYEMPVGFSVLTCYTPEQAMARSQINPCNEDTNKGYEAASVVIELINLFS